MKNPKLPRYAHSLRVDEAYGNGKYFTKSVITWELMWIKSRTIPHGQTGVHGKVSSLLVDEDIQLYVMEFVASKKEAITARLLAQAVFEYVGPQVAGEKVLNLLSSMHEEPSSLSKRRRISVGTARNWLKSMGYDWRTPRKNVYVDGQEREDVVAYRQTFLDRYKELEPRLARWDEDSNL